MINNYNHLNYTNRILIKEYLSKNYSIRKISKEIKKVLQQYHEKSKGILIDLI